MSRTRASSVVPEAAVKPKRARVDRIRPSVVDAFRPALSRTSGCRRFPTSRPMRPRSSRRGRLSRPLTQRSTELFQRGH
ncbi:hypothetical protein SUDANB6_05856 [Streptomyces sp. enrichment culture]